MSYMWLLLTSHARTYRAGMFSIHANRLFKHDSMKISYTMSTFHYKFLN